MCLAAAAFRLVILLRTKRIRPAWGMLGVTASPKEGEAVTGRSSSVRRSSASLCGGNRPLGELVMTSRHEVSYLSNQG